MRLGRVTGAVWATRKSDELGGRRLLLVTPWDPAEEDRRGEVLVCADLIGAGPGERVILTTGGGARRALGEPGSPVDAAVVAIVDGWEVTAPPAPGGCPPPSGGAESPPPGR